MSLRDHLQSIYNSYGRLTPSLVVDEARLPDHPLHSHFEWNDTIAGEEYRKVQAGDLIRSVKIKYRKKNDEQQSCRYFVSVQREDGYNYEPVTDVVNDPVTKEIVLREMEREWKQLKTRYGHMKEFFDLVLSDANAKETLTLPQTRNVVAV